jgi:hypothetical protein
MQNEILNNEETIKEERKVMFSVNHLIKENETAKQYQKRLAAERKKATNDAGKNLVKAINGEFISLSLIRGIFAGKINTNKKSKEKALYESVKFCAALSSELGKKITVECIYKLPIRNYLDFVNETEAARGMIRGGITTAEFRNIILRYYRGEKPKFAQLVDADIKDVLNTVYRNK